MNVMKEIDEGFKHATNIAERRYYKIFYSHIHKFPLLVIGQNPGGEIDGTDLVASEGYFENWEHDFVCFRKNTQYKLARPMCDLLASVLRTNSLEALRQVPVSNVIFRRSRNTESLNLSPPKAAKESAPFLAEITKLVNPKAILITSKKAYDLFTEFHCTPGSVKEDQSTCVYTPNGKNNACIYQESRGYVEALDREIPLLMVGHPSKYSGRSEWSSITDSLRRALTDLDVSPIEKSGAITEIPRILKYGSRI